MHFDNLLVILLGLAFVVLRWLAQRATNPNKQPPQEPERPTRAPAESEEERVRRFMEALGNPADSKPPPKVTPRPVQQASPVADAARKAQETVRRRSILTGPLPPLTTTPPPPRRIEPSTPTATPRASEIQPRPARAVAPVATVRQPREPDGAVPDTVAAWLASPESLRNAVIIREILGPPRALQSLESFAV